MDLRTQLTGLDHHAYLLIGGDSIRVELISILEKKFKVATHGNPDFDAKQYENFTIDDARELKSLASLMPVNPGGKRIFIVTMNAITVEAQNALLKLLEEPAEYVHFFLIVPSAHLLLPTVRSRLSMIGNSGQSENESVGLADAKKFLTMMPPKRLEIIKSLVEDITKEKKTKQDAIDFLNNIQSVVYGSKGSKSGKQALETIEKARTYMNDRAPSLKMLLEYVALNI